jgi:hypothetical protein
MELPHCGNIDIENPLSPFPYMGYRQVIGWFLGVKGGHACSPSFPYEWRDWGQ